MKSVSGFFFPHNEMASFLASRILGPSIISYFGLKIKFTYRRKHINFKLQGQKKCITRLYRGQKDGVVHDLSYEKMHVNNNNNENKMPHTWILNLRIFIIPIVLYLLYVLKEYRVSLQGYSCYCNY